MEIGESHVGNHIVLRPIGRLDNDTSPAFQERLVQAVLASNEAVILDFGALDYISSAGLRALITASNQKPGERRICIAAAKPAVAEVFTISRFDQLIPLFGTIDAAAAGRRRP